MPGFVFNVFCLNLDFGRTVFFHVQLPGSSSGDVYGAALGQRATVIDGDRDLLAILQVSYLGLGSHRQTGVGCRHGVWVEFLTSGGFVTVKFFAIPRSLAYFLVSCFAAGILWFCWFLRVG